MQQFYRDGYGRLHRQVITESIPLPTDRAWLCTAVADKLKCDAIKLSESSKLLSIDRLSAHPFERTGIISHYELFGLSFFGLSYKHIYMWRYHGKKVPFFMRHAFLKRWGGYNPIYHIAYLFNVKSNKDEDFLLVRWLLGEVDDYSIYNLFHFRHPVREILGRNIIADYTT